MTVIANKIVGTELPEHPHFIREVVVIPYKNQLLVDGTRRLQVLNGSFFRDLIPLIDGSRDIHQLIEAFPGVDSENVIAAISLLFERGLLEDSSLTQDKISINADTLGFFRRFAGSASNRGARETYDLLQTSEIAITAPHAGGHAEFLQSMLMDVGAKQAKVLPSIPSSWNATSISDNCIIVAFSLMGENPDWFRECNEWCLRYKKPWLRTVVDEEGGYADIGPLFSVGRPCYECFRQAKITSESSPQARVINHSQSAFWLSQLAIEVVYLISRIGPSLSKPGFRRYAFKNWNSEDISFARRLWCAHCRPLRKRSIENMPCNEGVASALAFEAAVEVPYPSITNHAAEREANLLGRSLSRETKILDDCSHIPLSFGPFQLHRSLRGPVDSSGIRAKMTLNELGTILKLTAGLRDDRTDEIKRWCATGGNLGSVELFVFIKNVDGIDSGIYFYQPAEHVLASMRPRRTSGELGFEELIKRAIVYDGLPDLFVVFTAAYHRVSRKYGPFAYKLINFDAGVAIAQLLQVSRYLQLNSRLCRAWADDILEKDLHLKTFDEQVTGIVALSSDLSIKPSADGSIHSGPKQSSYKQQMNCYGGTAQAAVRSLFDESRMTEGDVIQYESPSTTTKSFLQSRSLSSTSVSLPDPFTEIRLDLVLKKRQSVRKFSSSFVSLNQISAMLSFAHCADVEEWPDERDFRSLSFYLLAWRVRGIPPGVYLYNGATQSLLHERDELSRGHAAELLVQNELATAPAQIWMVGNLSVVCTRYGAWGHRQLLLRAGAAANRLWMKAIDLGLAGTIVAGLVSGAAQIHLGFDGYLQAAMLSFPVGVQSN